MLVWAVPDQGFHCGHHFNSSTITDFGGRVVVNPLSVALKPVNSAGLTFQAWPYCFSSSYYFNFYFGPRRRTSTKRFAAQTAVPAWRRIAISMISTQSRFGPPSKSIRWGVKGIFIRQFWTGEHDGFARRNRPATFPDDIRPAGCGAVFTTYCLGVRASTYLRARALVGLR